MGFCEPGAKIEVPEVLVVASEIFLGEGRAHLMTERSRQDEDPEAVRMETLFWCLCLIKCKPRRQFFSIWFRIQQFARTLRLVLRNNSRHA